MWRSWSIGKSVTLSGPSVDGEPRGDAGGRCGLEEQMRRLTELQKADSRLMALQKRREELPGELERISREIQTRREKLQKAQEEFEGLKAQRRKREKDLELEVERVKKSQGRLFEAKTNKEYQALMKEIEAAKEANSALEEEILLLMEKMDQRAREVQAMDGEFRRVDRDLSSRQQAIRAELEGLEAQESTARTQRDEVAGSVDPGWVGAYGKVAKRYNGLAVVRVDGGTCQGCFVSIPPQLYNEILKSGHVVQCPFCMRFIYHEPRQAGAGDSPEKR